MKAAEATLQTAKLNLDYTEVRAPVDGRVGRIEITVGNLVAAGTSSPVLTSLVSVNPIYASFDADEDVVLRALELDRGCLRQARQPRPDSGRDVDLRRRTAKGHIQLIDNQVNGQSGTIRVRAVFHNEDGRLIPGQFARVRMGQPQAADAGDGGRACDRHRPGQEVRDGGRRRQPRALSRGHARRPVDGLAHRHIGLKSGDRIVVNGLQRVRPGALVKSSVAGWARTAAAMHRPTYIERVAQR